MVAVWQLSCSKESFQKYQKNDGGNIQHKHGFHQKKNPHNILDLINTNLKKKITKALQ